MVVDKVKKKPSSITAIIVCSHFSRNAIDSCLNSLCYQLKPFDELIVVVHDNDVQLVKESVRFCESVSVYVKVVGTNNNYTEAEMIPYALSSASSEYVFFIDAKDRAHESLLDVAADALDGETDVVVCSIGMYTSDGALHVIKAPSKDKSLNSILKNNISNFFAGKIWRKFFLKKWVDLGELSFTKYGFTPIVLSYSDKVAVVHNKREPLYFHSTDDEYINQSWIPTSYTTKELLNLDSYIIDKANPSYKLAVQSCLAVRACVYYRYKLSDRIMISDYLRNIYDQILMENDEGDINNKVLGKIENILENRQIIPSRIFLSDTKEKCSSLLESLKNNGFYKDFEVLDINQLIYRYQIPYKEEMARREKLIVVLKAIEEMGGIYLDSSLVCCDNFGPVQNNRAFFCSIAGNQISDLIFGGEAHHPIIRDLMGRLIGCSDQSFEAAARNLLVGKYGMNLTPEKQIISGGACVYLAETFLVSMGVYSSITRLNDSYLDGKVVIPEEIYSEKIALVRQLKKELTRNIHSSEQYRKKMQKLAQKNLKIRTSVSWRITEPIRGALRRVRRLKKG